MRVEVVIPRFSGGFGARAALYTYSVPQALVGRMLPGQLIAVPFGETIVPAIVWALDASDETADVWEERRHARDGASHETPADGADPIIIRPINELLFDEPLLPQAQRALAEWIADYYAAPLATAVALLTPPGLLRELRPVARLVADPPAASAEAIMGECAIVLTMLRERRQVEHRRLVEVFGAVRAHAILRTLADAGLITRGLAVPHSATSLDGGRQARIVRLVAPSAALDAWRGAARARLDAFDSNAAPRPVAAPAARSLRGRRAQSPLLAPPTVPAQEERHERRAERLLRQLATLDALARPDRSGAPVRWRLEELRRLTRATENALNELVDAGLIVIETTTLRHDPLAGRALPPSQPLALNPAQRRAYDALVAALPPAPHGTTPAAPHASRTFLLHGITGSGKTEVYLQAMAAAIARGLRGVVLAPEIALTPQAMARFAGRFPGRVALLHSGLTDAERLDEWRRIRRGEVDVVLGSRSAIFAPIDRLGLIIIDEEHEAAYKQDRTPTYHARDVAARLGALTGAVVVLGSATPAIESYWFASQGVYTLLELRQRAISSVAGPGAEQGDDPDASAHGLPPVTIIDLRAELRAGATSILSEALRLALRQTLEQSEQSILFLNRRGSASSVICRECGHVARCERCDISMTYHVSERAILCHYCGDRAPLPEVCPACGSASFRFFGIGTERIELGVKRLFPAARVLRWDRDTARRREDHEALLRAFAERRADILVGTQMIAKGLDLPGVTLVGIISADVALFLPDFRAAERAFQLLTQVAGRAGRGTTPGRVLAQTFNPEHFCIEAAARHDYAAFYAAEIAARQRYGYPPFRRFVKFVYAHRDRYTAQVEATALYDRLERLIREQQPEGVDLVGPAPAFMERLQGRYRWQVILRAGEPRPLVQALLADGLSSGWAIDIDPANTL